jgi:hypothetical protein
MVMPVISNVRMQGLSHVVHDSIPENNEGERFRVPLKMLDNLPELVNSPKRISAIKIDVENFEFFVLDGAKQLINRNRPVIYAELWENENRSKCFELLKGLNYKIVVISGKQAVEYDPGKHSTQNFIFLPQ